MQSPDSFRRQWWIALTVSWIVLLQFQILQVALSMTSLGVPIPLGAFALGQVIAALAMAPTLPALYVLSRRAPLARIGGARYALAALFVLGAGVALSTVLFPWLLELPGAPRVVMRGSLLGSR